MRIALEKFAQLSIDHFCVTNTEGRFVKVNALWTETFGWSQEEFLTKPYMDFVHPDDHERTIQRVSALHAGAESNTGYFENRYLHKNGSYRWLSWRGVLSEDGKLVYAIARDVTDQKRAELLSEKIAKAANIGAWEINLSTDTLYWTDQVHAIVGTDPLTFRPTLENTSHFFHKSSAPLIREAHEKLMQFGTPYDLRVKYTRTNGEVSWVRAIGFPEFRQGKVSKIYGTLQDIGQQLLQEDLLDKMIENLPVALFAKSAQDNFKFIRWNRKAEELFGIPREAAMGKSDYAFFPKGQADFFRQKDLEVFENKNMIEIKEEVVNSSKGKRWLNTFKVPLFTHDQKPHVMLAISQDITEQREAKMRTHLALKFANMGTWEWKIPTNELTWDETQYELTGLGKLGVKVSKVDDWKQFLHPDDRARTSERIQKALESGDTFETAYRLLVPGQEMKIINSTALIERDHDGKALRLIGLSRDVTEDERHERELESQRAMALNNSKMASLGEMAGGLAHEINNPVAIIQGKVLQLLHRMENQDADETFLRRELLKIEETTSRISKIVKGLRTFARHSENDPPSLESVGSIIEDTLEFCKARCRSAGIDLKVYVTSDISLLCRPAQISQILLNLINNAYDAVVNLEERWIQISAEKTTEHVILKVTDSGLGIPPAVAKKIMEPFYTTKDVDQGTGLGLSISKGLVESHGGTLSYDPECKHTRFVMKFPLPAQAKMAA